MSWRSVGRSCHWTGTKSLESFGPATRFYNPRASHVAAQTGPRNRRALTSHRAAVGELVLTSVLSPDSMFLLLPRGQSSLSALGTIPRSHVPSAVQVRYYAAKTKSMVTQRQSNLKHTSITSVLTFAQGKVFVLSRRMLEAGRHL